jgi:hypothetical protein
VDRYRCEPEVNACLANSCVGAGRLRPLQWTGGWRVLGRNSNERLALLSLVYNAESLLGDRLQKALINDDRRYRSNKLGNSNRDGVANRRYQKAFPLRSLQRHARFERLEGSVSDVHAPSR